jgi:HK97 family phage prohead protease
MKIKEKYENKVFTIAEMKTIEEDGAFYLEGYVNTKNKPDAYGDIPTNYNGNPVYILDRIKANPVAFVDHYNSAAMIAGNWVSLEEDSIGLKAKLKLRPLDQIYNDEVKDAVSAYMTGFGRAFSIGGRWYYEDQNNPMHLTKALIHEISLVGVGADGSALSETIPRQKSKSQEVEESKSNLVDFIAKTKKFIK